METENRFYRKPNTKWTAEIMAGAVYAIKEFGRPINHTYLRINHTSLYEAIRNYPGGWKLIVSVAGLSPDEETKANRRRKGTAEPYDTSY